MRTTVETYEWYYYRPQRSCGQGNIFTPVCHSFCSQGGSASVHAGIPPWEQTPLLGADTPLEQTHPPGADTPRGADPPGADTPWADPLGADTPPEQTPPGADTPQEQTPPPGSRLQHTVYERPVRILLECILVSVCECSLNICILIGGKDTQTLTAAIEWIWAFLHSETVGMLKHCPCNLTLQRTTKWNFHSQNKWVPDLPKALTLSILRLMQMQTRTLSLNTALQAWFPQTLLATRQ